MSARWALGLALGALLAGCESGVNRELAEKPYPYSCDRGTADAGCSHGWRCGLDGRCFNPALIEPRRCERALDRGTDGGFDCSGGWRCGLDGLCFDPSADAGLPRACNHGEERDGGAYDCAEGWRCGLDDRCFPLVVNDDAGVSSAVSRVCDRAQEERGQGLDCPLGWRCGVDERCFNEAQAAQRSCDRPFERRHDGGFDCTQGWRCGLDNRCFDPSPDAGAPRPCDRAGELGGDGYDCAEGWHCSVTNACFRPTADPLRACDRALERARDGGYDCAPDWRCGLDQHCFDPASGAARACDRAEQLDAGTAYDCAAGWRCGPEGTCFEVAQAGARGCDPTLGNADCRGGWRCGYTGVCHDQDAGEPYPCRDDGDCERPGDGWRCDQVAHACAQVTDRLTTGRWAPSAELRSPLLSWPVPTLAALSDELPLSVDNATGDLSACAPGPTCNWTTSGRVMAQVVNGRLQLGVHGQDVVRSTTTRASFLHAECGGGPPASLATLGAYALATYADGGVQTYGLRLVPGPSPSALCLPVPLPATPATDGGPYVRVTTGATDGGSAAVLFTATSAVNLAAPNAGSSWSLSDADLMDVVEMDGPPSMGPPPSSGPPQLVALTRHQVAILMASVNASLGAPPVTPGAQQQSAAYLLDGLVPGAVPTRLLVGPPLPATLASVGDTRLVLVVIWNSSLTGKPVAATFLARVDVSMSMLLEYRGTVSLCPGNGDALALSAGPNNSPSGRLGVLVRCGGGFDAAANLSVPERTWLVSANGSPVAMEAPRLAPFDEDLAPFQRSLQAPTSHPASRAFFGAHGQVWSYTRDEVAALDPALVPHRVVMDREPDLIFRYPAAPDAGPAEATTMAFQGPYQFDVGEAGLVARFRPESGFQFLATGRNAPFLALTSTAVIGGGRVVGADGPQVVAVGTTTFQRPATVTAVTTPSGDQDLFVTSYDGIFRARVTSQLGNPNVAPATLVHGFTPVAGNPIQSFAAGTARPADGGAPELRGYAVVRGQVYTFVLDGTVWTADRVATDIGAGLPIDVMRLDTDGGSVFRLGYDTGVVAAIPAVAPLSERLDGGERVTQYAQVCGDTYALGSSGVWRAVAHPGALATWTPVALPPGLAPPSRLYGGASTIFVATPLGEVVEIAYDGGAGTSPVCH